MIFKGAEIHHWLRGRGVVSLGRRFRHFPVEHLVDDVCRPIFSISLILSGTKALLYSSTFTSAHNLHTRALIINTNTKIAEVKVNQL